MTATIPQEKMAPRGTVTDSLVSLYGEVFHQTDGFLAAYNVEREEEIELLGLSTIAGLDPLFIGAPGVGKTWMIELLLMVLVGAQESSDFFNTLIFKETPADDILGPRSVPAMKEGRIERLMDGYLPMSVIAYLDEIFKASPTLWNALLDIMANRKLKIGDKVHKLVRLLCIFGSSNELPQREDALPLRDRFGLTKFVNPVASREGRLRVLRIMDEYQAESRNIDLSDAPQLHLEDVQRMRAEVDRIIIPDPIFEEIATAEERWAGKHIEPSQRRMGQMARAIKAVAWSNGRGEVKVDDLLVCQHMAWNHPDHRKDAREIIIEFANEFLREGLKARKAMEPILTAMSELRNNVPSDGRLSDEQMTAGSNAAQDLREMTRTVKEQIEKGERRGADTSELESVLHEIEGTRKWLRATMMGTDIDDD